MITATSSLLYCPQLRREIVIGPGQRIGHGTVYHLKDTFTGGFYRVGEREYFLLSRMDGSRSLQDIGTEYAAVFGRQMSDISWQNLFNLLEKRQMLMETADAAKLEALKQEVKQRRKQENSGWLRRRFALVQPDDLLERLLPYFRFAFQRRFVIPALLCIALLEIFVLSHIPSLANDAWTHRQLPSYVIFMVIALLFIVFHEFAHGLACKYFGGSVSEIGILWRYLSFFPYCKIDDVMLFHNRWHRVYTAFAGVFINLLSIIPFGLVWIFASEGSLLRQICAIMLLSFNFTIFMNFIPFVELDGYFMLNHALNMVNLRKESHQFWQRLALRLFLKREGATVEYVKIDKQIYIVYGFFSLFFTALFLGGMCLYWIIFMHYWLGNMITGCVLVVALLLLLYQWRGKVWITQMRHRRA